MEDTAALTKFLQIDVDGIKRERSNQLASVLNSSVADRQKEFHQAQETLILQQVRLTEAEQKIKTTQDQTDDLLTSIQAKEGVI